MGRWNMHGCGPGGRRGFPEALLAMAWGGRGGWQQGWDRDWGDFGGRGGPRGRRRSLGSGELRHVLLKLIADQPRHGYDLIRAVEELTHGSYAPSPGVVYPTLTMLQDMGFIEETQAEGSRKVFAATEAGRSHLAERAEEIDALMARLSGLGNERRRAGGAPIKRSVGNLLSALWHRTTREDMNEEALHEIAAILDEAARKIERLK